MATRCQRAAEVTTKKNTVDRAADGVLASAHEQGIMNGGPKGPISLSAVMAAI
jgi:hypothetical protein